KDPNLDPNDPVGGARFGETEVDVGTQGVERHAPFAIGFYAAHVGAAKPARAANSNSLGAELHGGTERLLHRATERNPSLELGRDVLRHELRVRLRLADFLNVDEHLVLGEGLDTRELDLALLGAVEVA